MWEKKYLIKINILLLCLSMWDNFNIFIVFFGKTSYFIEGTTKFTNAMQNELSS